MLAGLVAVTPCAGYVPTWAAAMVALAAGWICYGATHLRAKRGWDDSLDVWGVHGVGGLFGTLCVGWFAYASVGGHNGLLAGDGRQFGLQCAGVAIAVSYAFCMSFAILKVVDLVASVQPVTPGAAQGSRRGDPRRERLRLGLTMVAALESESARRAACDGANGLNRDHEERFATSNA